MWDPERKNDDISLADEHTLCRPNCVYSNPAAYGKQTLIPSRNYLEYEICKLSSWICLGFTNDTSVAIDGGGVFGKNTKTTCAIFHQSDTSIRTYLDDFTLPVQKDTSSY